MQNLCVFALLAAVVAVTTFEGVDGFTGNIRAITVNPEQAKLLEGIENKVQAIYNTTYEGFRKKTKEITALKNENSQIAQAGFEDIKLKLRENTCTGNKKNRMNQRLETEQKKMEECIEDATKAAKEKIRQVSVDFTDKTLGVSNRAQVTIQLLGECFQLKSEACKSSKMLDLEAKVKETEKLGLEGLRKVTNVEQGIQQCTKDLQTVKDKFTTFLGTCKN